MEPSKGRGKGQSWAASSVAIRTEHAQVGDSPNFAEIETQTEIVDDDKDAARVAASVIYQGLRAEASTTVHRTSASGPYVRQNEASVRAELPQFWANPDWPFASTP